MEHITYIVKIDKAEEGGYIASVPALPGCATQGETYEETVAMARECIEGFVEALAIAGQPIPVETQADFPSTISVQIDMPVAQ